MNQGKDQFIILRATKYSESDLILQALSSQGEKRSFIARGALKSKKRFGGGVLEPSHFVTLIYKEARETGQLCVLQEATLLNGFVGLRQDYDRLQLALHVLDCVNKVSQEGDRSSDFLFNLLGHTLKAAETVQEPQVLKLHFYLKLLLQQGVVQAEEWMKPFLATRIADTNHLLPFRQTAAHELANVEAMVRHYLDYAMLDPQK